MNRTKPELTAIEQARQNLQYAEDYLKTMLQALEDAQYRVKIAREQRNEADAALVRAETVHALRKA